MNKEHITRWFKNHFNHSTVKVGSHLLLSLSLFLEESEHSVFNATKPYIKPEQVSNTLIKLQDRGWAEVTIEENLFDFIADVDDILTILAFK